MIVPHQIDISSYLQQILTAVYGEEVRGSIHNALAAMRDYLDLHVVAVDDSLSQTGQAADAKAIGDAIAALTESSFFIRGILGDDSLDLNIVREPGVYRLTSNHNYINCPLETKTGWLVVYQYGSSGNSLTQQAIETGTSDKIVYKTFLRTANTSNDTYTWGPWQNSIPDTDITLSIEGAPADAKQTGIVLGRLAERITNVDEGTLGIRGVLEDGSLNDVVDHGVYRLTSNHVYTNSPLTTPTGWLIVYQYGSAGNSLTQQVIETGTDSSVMYKTHFRSANTTNDIITWAPWQNNMIEIDTSLGIEGAAADAKTVGDRLADIEYSPIEILDFRINPSVVEKGDEITSIEFIYELNQNPVRMTIDGTEIEPSIAGNYTLQGLTQRTNRTWTLKAWDNGSGGTIKSSRDSMGATLKFVNRVYWGTAEIPEEMTPSFLETNFRNNGSELSETRDRTFEVTANTGEYIWYAYPAEYGLATFDVGGFTGGFKLVYTMNFTSIYNDTRNYYIYRSVQPSLGQIEVAVS